MYFQHSPDLWSAHPELVAGAVLATGITADASLDARTDRYHAVARARLNTGTEAEFGEIRAWRRTFAAMGLKPTQYRCAAESLLRRYRKEGSLPRIHPVIDLCNALSVAYAIPVGVFDADRVTGHLEVRHADGGEEYLTFSGAVEHPEPREVIFADGSGRAHARRWTNRQSGYSAVSSATSTVLVVAEALHPSADVDVPELTAAIATELSALWPTTPKSAVLSASAPRFQFAD